MISARSPGNRSGKRGSACMQGCSGLPIKENVSSYQVMATSLWARDDFVTNTGRSAAFGPLRQPIRNFPSALACFASDIGIHLPATLTNLLFNVFSRNSVQCFNSEQVCSWILRSGLSAAVFDE